MAKADVQMRFGPDVVFSLATQQYDQFRERIEVRGGEVDTMTGVPVIHHVGYRHTVELSGVRFPLDQGSDAVQSMRAAIRSGEPQIMTDGLGYVWGEWYAKSLSVTGSDFFAANVAGKQSYTLSLQLYKE